MDKLQQKKLTMYRRVTEMVDLPENTAIFGALPMWANYYPPFKANIEVIQTKANEQALPTTAPAAEKMVVHDELVAAAEFLRVRLEALGMNTNNLELEMEMDFSESDLVHKSDVELVGVCELVHGRAVEFIGVLVAEYGVTNGAPAALQAKIDSFTDMIGKPEVAKDAHKEVTDSLVPLFAEEDELLKRMGKLAVMLKNTHPVQYGRWVEGVKLGEIGYHTISLRGTTKDSVSGVVIPKAMVEVNGIEVRGTVKGNFMVKHIVDGYYELHVKAPGYVDYMTHVTIVSGLTADVGVRMVHV